MAAASTPFLPSICCASSTHRASSAKLSIYAISVPLTTPRSHLSASHLRLTSWSGLRNLGAPSALKFICLREKKRKCGGKAVYASLFGVGAPEALVIGVVALLVFGPKGLAEVARNLGKTLRSFQPTIRELQEVSREFKSTLEREIGLDEVEASKNYANKTTTTTENKEQAVVDPNGKPSTGPKTYEELLKITENQLAKKSQMEASEGQAQVPDSENSEFIATSVEEQPRSLGAENSQEAPPTIVEVQATQDIGEIEAISKESKVSPSDSPAQVASETQSSDRSSETEETVTA